MTRDGAAPERTRSTFSSVLVRVLVVQAVSLAILGTIQVLYPAS